MMQRLLRPMCRSSVRSLLAAVVVLAASSAARGGPEIPGAPQQQPIALVGGAIFPIDGPAIPHGTLLFDQGRIVALGTDVEIPQDAEVIDVTGKQIYPGMLNADGQLGLVEINSVRGTLDFEESGDINPNAKAQVAVNPDSELIPVTRANGVLLALTSPTGGLIRGTSAVIQLDGWTWEEMTLKAPVALHIAWPASGGRRSGGRSQANAALERLQQALDDARAYRRAREAGTSVGRDIRWEAMLPVLSGELPVIVEADTLAQIEGAVALADRYALKLIILGGYDAPRCAALLKQHHVPVIVAGVYRLPLRRSDPYDYPYALPEKLRAAGIAFCIAGTGRFDAANARNLPYHAATAAAYGLPADEALKAVTLYPAQILGVADRVGSLAPGKDATLIVTDGNPLDTETHVLRAYIQGRTVDLSNRHQRLWEKYQEKYRRMEQ